MPDQTQALDQTQTLSFTRTIAAPAAQIYQAFTNATYLRTWLCDVATAVPRPGGRLYLAWNDGYYMAGEYTGLERDRRIAFKWLGRGEPKATQVQVDLSAQDGGIQVTLEHSGLESGEGWAALAEEFRKGWDNGLDNLKSVLESGEDLRFVRRPMLGILSTDFNPEVAEKLGVPVSEGACLGGTLEEMGAYAAGLRKDDVIISLAGKPIVSWNSLPSALDGHYAGETVEVIYYRGPEKHSVMMELSRRPIPELPDTPAGLADYVRKTYSDIDAELARLFAGVSEQEAGFNPAADEWSAKEILGHLVLSERFNTYYLAETMSGQVRWSDDFSGNINEQVRAVVAAYPTVRELLDELKRNEAETIHMLAAMPASFIAHKGDWWALRYAYMQPQYHAQQHYDQIRAAIQAARQH